MEFTGAFVKPKYPLGDNLEVFGRVGTNNLTITSSYNGKTSNSYSSYGGGLTAYIDAEKKSYISAEYMVWASQGLEKLTGGSVAFGRRF